jgi:hypothetical protein
MFTWGKVLGIEDNNCKVFPTPWYSTRLSQCHRKGRTGHSTYEVNIQKYVSGNWDNNLTVLPSTPWYSTYATEKDELATVHTHEVNLQWKVSGITNNNWKVFLVPWYSTRLSQCCRERRTGHSSYEVNVQWKILAITDNNWKVLPSTPWYSTRLSQCHREGGIGYSSYEVNIQLKVLGLTY